MYCAGRCRLRSISGASGPFVRTPRSATHSALRGLRNAAFAAVGSFFVLAGAVAVPVRRLHQFLEALGVAFAEQITGLLPAEDVARRHTPWRAFIALVAGEEVEEQPRMHEVPLLALAEREHVAEQLLGLGAVEEVFLVGSALIGITRRH